MERRVEDLIKELEKLTKDYYIKIGYCHSLNCEYFRYTSDFKFVIDNEDGEVYIIDSEADEI